MFVGEFSGELDQIGGGAGLVAGAAADLDVAGAEDAFKGNAGFFGGGIVGEGRKEVAFFGDRVLEVKVAAGGADGDFPDLVLGEAGLEVGGAGAGGEVPPRRRGLG
jgi:hypothetical protein